MRIFEETLRFDRGSDPVWRPLSSIKGCHDAGEAFQTAFMAISSFIAQTRARHRPRTTFAGKTSDQVFSPFGFFIF
jgi:hypothetical protein